MLEKRCQLRFQQTGREAGRPGLGCSRGKGTLAGDWGRRLQPQLCLSLPGPVALGRCPTLSGLQFPICTVRPSDNMVSMQDVASEPRLSREGS